MPATSDADSTHPTRQRDAPARRVDGTTFGTAAQRTRPLYRDATFGADAYAPTEIAARVRDLGVTKARLPWATQAMLGVLAGAFIGFGALMFTLVASDASLGFAVSRLLGGLAFSLGLLLVMVAGAELFTGTT